MSQPSFGLKARKKDFSGVPKECLFQNKINVKDNITNWYVLRVPYGREMKLKALLDTLNITSFVAVQRRKKIVQGKEETVMVSAINNIIFINTTRRLLDDLKKSIESSIPFRFMMDRATRMPMIVPTQQMEHFIAVAGSMDEQLLYLSAITPVLLSGDKVRVTGGAFQGIEGYVVRIKKDRRVMVMLNTQIAVATGYIPPLLLERID